MSFLSCWCHVTPVVFRQAYIDQQRRCLLVISLQASAEVMQHSIATSYPSMPQQWGHAVSHNKFAILCQS